MSYYHWTDAFTNVPTYSTGTTRYVPGDVWTVTHVHYHNDYDYKLTADYVTVSWKEWFSRPKRPPCIFGEDNE